MKRMGLFWALTCAILPLTLQTADARPRNHPKPAPAAITAAPVDSFEAVDGVVTVPGARFTETYLYVRNCAGSKIYDPAAYYRATQGSLIENIPSDPACTGEGIGGFQPVNGAITITKPLNYADLAGPYDTAAQFKVYLLDEPDHHNSYQALPRILLEIHAK